MNESAILAGRPGAISGFVPFHNTTKSSVTITEVTIDEADSSASLVVAVDETVVLPGQRAKIELRTRFAPHTVPGEYAIELTIAGKAIPALVYVDEDHDIGLSPDYFAVENIAGATFMKTLVVANEGNVDVHLGAFSDLPLYPEDASRTSLARLATTRLLDGAVEVDPLPEPYAMLQVRPANGAQAVAAGETAAIELEMRIPKDLPQNMRLLAAIPIALRTVIVAVLPRGDAPSKEK